MVRKATRRSVANTQLDIAKNCKENPKKFWQYVNSRTSTVSKVGDIKATDNNSTHVIRDDQDKVKAF